MTEVLNKASSGALHHRGELLVSEPVQFDANGVELLLIPKRGMTYWVWDTALWGMRISVQDHRMYYEWSFTIITTEYGEVGSGFLRGKRNNMAETNKM